MAEKVVHNPDIMACHAQGRSGWTWAQTLEAPRFGLNGIGMQQIDIVCASPPTLVRVSLPNGETYEYRKLITSVIRPLNSDRFTMTHGQLQITCTGAQSRCTAAIDLAFSGERETRQCAGAINGPDGSVGTLHSLIQFHLQPQRWLFGDWSKVLFVSSSAARTDATTLYSVDPISDESITFNYGFRCAFSAVKSVVPLCSDFAVSLNEPIIGCLPVTDSRRRPDVRLLEQGKLAEANVAKLHMEAKQRDRRKGKVAHVPLWFKPVYPPMDVVLKVDIRI